MVIGIEGQRLFRKNKHGMDMVALELIRNLQEIDNENKYYIFVKPDDDRSALRETENFRIVELRGGPYPMWEQVALPEAARKYKCELLHCTSNTAPLFSTVPVIITLHDIIYMEKSVLNIISGRGSYYQRFGNIYRRIVVPRVLKRSRKIITVSDFERQRISDFFRLKQDGRLVTVYNGVGSYFKPVRDETILRQVKEKYKLPDKYFFFLGNTDPKKNTRGVLKAYADFIRETGSQVKLVMLDFDRQELADILEETGVKNLVNNIHLTGYVDNQELPGIYSQSELFLYPSLRESFGIPILEAMSCGIPVITSNTSSMPEIAGQAAILVDPFKPEEITRAMISVFTDKVLQQELIQKGIEQASAFSWRSMAEKVLGIYTETVARNS